MAKKKTSKASRRTRDANGLYVIHKFICIRPDGTRYYERFRGPVYNDVVIAANTFKKEYLAGMHRDADKKHPEEKPLTLGEAMDKYIDTCRVLCAASTDYSDSTIPGYISIRKNAFQEIVNKPINEITVDDVQSYIDSALQKKSVKTVRNEYYFLKPVVEKYAPDIDLSKIKLAKKKKRKKRVMKNSSIPLIISAMAEEGPEFLAYGLFIIFLGLRQSESYGLLWGDLSAEKKVAIVNGQRVDYGTVNINKASVRNEFASYTLKDVNKTEAGTRIITEDWSFFEALYSVLPRGRDDQRIFSLKPNLLPYRWNKVREKLGLPEKMTMYDLRHYQATALFAVGAPEAYVAARMGHSSTQMTHAVYEELLEEKQQEINLSMSRHTAALINASFATASATTKQKSLDITAL